MRCIGLLVTLLQLPLALRSQTAADTAAVDSILLAEVLAKFQLGDDYAPPVRLPLHSDSSWSGRLYTRLRAQHGELVKVEPTDSISNREPGLTLRVSVHDFSADSAEARFIWVRCTPRVALLNHWTHEVRAQLRKAATGWFIDRPHYLAVGDGHC